MLSLHIMDEGTSFLLSLLVMVNNDSKASNYQQLASQLQWKWTAVGAAKNSRVS